MACATGSRRGGRRRRFLVVFGGVPSLSFLGLFEKLLGVLRVVCLREV